MDSGGLYRCEATADNGEHFVRYLSTAGGSVLASFRSFSEGEGFDLRAVTIYRCNAKGRPLRQPVVTWERPA